VSDKETAPQLELRKALRDAIDLICKHHEIGFIRRAYEQGTGSCELCKDDQLLRFSKILEDAPHVTPWKSSFTHSDVTGNTHNYVDTGDGKRLWAEDADEIVKRHNAPQGTPTDLLAVIERLANHGSVEDYTVEGIRAELREALHTFRPQGTPAPDEQAELAIYEQHIAELTARQKKPLSQQDRMWINGYRQGWLACLTRKRPTATPQCPQCGSKDFWTVLPACHGGKAHKWHAKEK
jgi:hypothetical protein